MLNSLDNAQTHQYIFDNARVGIVVCKTIENIIEVINPAFASIYGYEMDELVGKSMCRIFATDCKKCNLRGKPLSYCTTKDIHFETTHTKKDGSSVDVSVHITVIKDERGEVKQRIANVVDISNRKKPEHIFQEINSKLEAIFSTIPDMVWIKDAQGNYLACNKTFEEVFQTKQSDVVGKTDYDFFTKEAADTCKVSDIQALQSDSVLFTEEVITYPTSGEKGIFEVRKVPVLEANGDVLGVLGMGRDIAQTIELQEALQKSEKHYRNNASLLHSVLESSDDVVIFALDREYKYLTFNQSHLKIMKSIWDCEVAVGMNMLDCISCSEDWKHAKALFDRALEGESFVDEAQYGDEEFSRSYWETHYSPIFSNDNKEIIGFTCYNINVTERKLMENALALKELEFRSLAENLPDNIARWDTAGNYLYLNSMMEKTLGVKAEEIVGKSMYTLFPHHTSVLQAIEKIQNREFDSLTVRQTVPNLDGTFEVHEVKIIAEKNERGELTTILGIGRDITDQVKMQEELVASEAQFRTITEHTPDTIARYDHNCVRTYANPVFATITGKDVKELLGKKPTHYYNSSDAIAYEEAIKRVMKTGLEEDFEYSWPDKENNIIISLIRLVPERDSIGKVKSVLATGRNITNLKKYEEKLTKQKEFQETLLKGVAEAGMSVNVIEEGKYIYTNNIELAIEYGYDETLSAKRPSFLETIHPNDKEKVTQMYQKRLNGEEVPNTYTVVQVKPNGEEREHEISVVLIPNTSPIQTLVVTKDVTEQKNIEKRIEFMAHHDMLTGLPNRLLLNDRAKQIVAKSKRDGKKAAVLFIDLDGFKTINDSLGHSVGDIVLKEVALRLQSCTRASDTLSRQGGDEFIFVAPDVQSIQEVETIAQKLIHVLKKSFIVNNQALTTSASIGITLYPEHGHDFEQLLQNADTAMYKAKETGKNTYCFFTQEMKHNMVGLLQMQNDLRKALKNGEFVLHYQPQIDLNENKIVGAEALIRWNHPIMGMIPPVSFISVAEECGYIVEIGEWVINEACNQASLWNQNGKDIVIAVNISALQFKRGNLINIIQNALETSGLDPKYLELELTESILIGDTENVLKTVKELKELGVQLSIDDFGTGYSSLAYLKRFAVDKLKIDQSFVRDILKDKEDATIVKTIIAMAKSFNLKSIAEGVENQEVLNLVKEFGCDEVQGYHFAKPMRADELKQYHQIFYDEL